MRISLIQAPVWGTYDPPLALAQLSSCLKKEGHKVFAFDINIELYLKRTPNYKDMWAWEQVNFWFDKEKVKKFFEDNDNQIDKIIKRIEEVTPDIICFSVSSSSYLSSLELARIFKEKMPNIYIIFGGPLFLQKDKIIEVLNSGLVDLVVYGEGEITITELVNFIENKKDLKDCFGIYFKENDKIIANPPRPYISNLDDLPFLDFTDLPLKNYDDSKHIPFMASRGCVWKCVFCSSKAFWQGFRMMSGKRIYNEIIYHKRNFKNLGHIDFMDLVFNGDMKSLVEFCDLMINIYPSFDIHWTANAVVRPEMTFEVLKKMKQAGCDYLIFGIESGSQRILNLMNKKFKIEDADRVIKDAHNAGIVVTANFMFGFPGETEEDFQKTLDFIKRNAPYLDRVYPSRTYCALEEYSYLHSHLEEFGIKPNPVNHLYWESIDGTNTYPERLRRCRVFTELANSLGIEVGCGVQTSVKLDEFYNLGFYYETKGNIEKAIEYFINYFKQEPKNEIICQKILNYTQKINESQNYILDDNLKQELKEITNQIKNINVNLNKSYVTKLSREKSIVFYKKKAQENSILNTEEFNQRKIYLESGPKAFFIQASGPCNSNCVFCSRGNNYEYFDLDKYRRLFEEKLADHFLCAERLILTGSGEFLLLPEAERILDYFDKEFLHVEKMFATNGSTLTPVICEKIVNSKSKYTIHISLHASNSKLHKTLTRTDNFDKIIKNIEYLIKLRSSKINPVINFVFVATTLNIEDLPDFIKLASNLGADKVMCYYNYIYVPAQKYLSCFFKQDLTNKIFEESEELAWKLKIPLELPPKFNQKEYPDRGICSEPWTQIMFNANGDILPCDASEDCSLNILKVDNFTDIWNSSYYQTLRKAISEKVASCFKYCFRANPSSVNDFRSHVIRRGRKEDIDILWEDNF